MFPEFNSTGYYIDLLALTALLAPAFIFTPNALARRIMLAAGGAGLLFFVAPRLTLFYALFWCVVFFLQRGVALTGGRKGETPLFWLCLLCALAPMCVWKIWEHDFSVIFNLWTNEGVRLISRDIWTIDLARAVIIPIGLSFATFRAADLLIKTYLDKISGLSLDRVLFYGFFPPVQIAGPIIEYEEIQNQGDAPSRPAPEDIYQGLMRIAFGLIKVLLIAAVLQKSAAIFDIYDSAAFYKIWALLILYSWFFYINFSGFSDLAIGVARLYGFHLKENFCFPYFRHNIAAFWNNWHMSLSRFAQRNAFVPLGGYRKGTQFIAILGTIMVIALWHDLSWGMVIFGLYHGAGLILHRIYADRTKKNKVETGEREEPESPASRLTAWGKIAATYLFVLLSFPLLALPLENAGGFYLALFGL